MGPRTARVGGGVTNMSAHMHQRSVSDSSAGEQTKHIANAEVSQVSARQLFTSRHGVGEAMGGDGVAHTDVTKKHVYVEGEEHAGFRFYEKEVETTKMQSRAMAEAALYADKNLVTPQWLKVSESPFMAAAKASGGYGRRMDDTTVSLDAPDFFHIKQVMDHDPKIAMSGSITGVKVQRHDDLQIRDDTTISRDVPDWMKIRHVVEFSDSLKTLDNAPHEHLLIGKQVLCEPYVEDDDEEPIDWDKIDEDDVAPARPEVDPPSARAPAAAPVSLPPVKAPPSARQGSARMPPKFSARSGGGDGATTARLALGEMSGRGTMPLSSSREHLFARSARG